MKDEFNDWDDAYDNVGHIPDAQSYPPMWAERAARYRDSADFAECDVAYGPHPRQKFDSFHPAGVSRGVLVFVHGGYWMRLDRSFWSHLAEGARGHGWTVVIPSYVLAPEARIGEITRQTGAAISLACRRYDGPVRLAGHSAGGQLVSRMVCEDSPLSEDERARIERVLSISGVHDLRPLLKTKMNQTLGLSTKEAEQESPCLHAPLAGTSLSAWVGAEERPEFLRQMQLLVDAWSRAGVDTRGVVDPGHHHFSVIEALADPQPALVKELLHAPG